MTDKDVPSGRWDSPFLEMLGDPTTPERKISLGRFVLLFITFNWVGWIWAQVIEFDPLSLAMILFGPGIAMAFGKDPLGAMKTLLRNAKNTAGERLSGWRSNSWSGRSYSYDDPRDARDTMHDPSDGGGS